MPVLRERKARDEHGKCGNQSADESVINRRPIGSRHTCQVEVLRRRCKLGAATLCVLTPHDGHESVISPPAGTDPKIARIIWALLVRGDTYRGAKMIVQA